MSVYEGDAQGQGFECQKCLVTGLELCLQRETTSGWQSLWPPGAWNTFS